MEALRFLYVEEKKRRFFFVIYTIARNMKKKIEEVVDLCMVENEKKSRMRIALD